MANINKGAQLSFKVGSQAKLDALNSYDNIPIADNGQQGIEGCFYLTADTHRLYIGNNDKTISCLNEGVITVKTLDDLPSTTNSITGQLFYVTGANVLCVYNGKEWVQINPDTDHIVNSVTAATSVASNVATISTSVGSTNGNGGTGSTITASYTVTGSNGVTVTNDSDNKGITIAGDTYTLSSSSDTTGTVDVKLASSNVNTNTSTVSIKAGDFVEVSNDNNVITIKSTDHNTQIDTITSAYGTENKGFKVTINQKDVNYNNATKSSPDFTINPTITVGVDSTARKLVDFVSGNALLDMVYTKDEVDKKEQLFNAMMYRGTISAENGSAGSALVISNNKITGIIGTDGKTALTDIKVGDVFMLANSFEVGKTSYAAGTLLIAQGTEDSSGYITSNLSFDIVDSTVNTDTQYKLVANSDNTGVILRESNSANRGSIVVSGDYNSTTNPTGIIQVTPTIDTDANATFTVSHKAITAPTITAAQDAGANKKVTQGNVSTMTIPVITNVTSDGYGHVTAIETTDYVVTDTNGSLENSITSGSSTDNTIGAIKDTLTFKNSKGGTVSTVNDDVLITSSTLKISTNASISGNVTIGSTATAVSGSGLAVDLVWGSFE